MKKVTFLHVANAVKCGGKVETYFHSDKYDIYQEGETLFHIRNRRNGDYVTVGITNIPCYQTAEVPECFKDQPEASETKPKKLTRKETEAML